MPFAIRTIRNGEVKIGGKIFRPEGTYLAYDGRCDGARFAFGRYRKPRPPGQWEPFVFLWGTEAAFRAIATNESGYGPHVVDGSLPWSFWKEVAHGLIQAPVVE